MVKKLSCIPALFLFVLCAFSFVSLVNYFDARASGLTPVDVLIRTNPILVLTSLPVEVKCDDLGHFICKRVLHFHHRLGYLVEQPRGDRDLVIFLQEQANPKPSQVLFASIEVQAPSQVSFAALRKSSA